MKQQQKRKLSLPATLLKELDVQGGSSHSGSRRGRGLQSQPSRKEQRKAQRVTKRQARTAPRHAQVNVAFRGRPEPNTARPVVQTLQTNKKNSLENELGSDKNSGSDREDNGDQDGMEDLDLDEDSMDTGSGGNSAFDESDESDESDEDLFSRGDDEEDDGEEDSEPRQALPTASKSDLKKLAQDDAEIAELEKKLGLKGKKSMPKSFDEDGLGDLLGDLDGGDEPEENPETRKRKAEADEWLAAKRRKAQEAAAQANKAKAKRPDRDDDMEDDGFDGFSEADNEDDEDQEIEPMPRQRENPYVAPTTNVAKYVPPSLRKKLAGDGDGDAQLRKRIQGLVNRLTNDSMIGITKDLSTLYTTNPRQTVTTVLTDIVLVLVCSPEKRPDAFFAMIAGFIAATHKALGMAFTAQFLQNLVETFDKYHANAVGDHSDSGSKHVATLLAELYNMQVISCNLIFDYVRLFLQNLNELNTELLLRIIQLCGPALRRDDPQSLQQILNRVKPVDGKGISVRTSFMIEEMKKLQSNKTKANARNKDLADQRTQLRKKIGQLPGASDVQPLRIGLQDIQNADKVGKWWLIGASWAGKDKAGNKASRVAEDDDDNILDDTMDFGMDDELDIPDLWQLAREQGFNTEVRQRIFVALHAATDYENADMLLKKLKLNKHQRKEIPEVIIRSAEKQVDYNPYYALVASKICGDREVKFQFRRCLTIRFRKMGEDIDMGDGENADFDEDEEYSMRWLYNSAKLYGSLVASRQLGLVDIVKHRNLMALQEKAQVFIELVMITVLQDVKVARLRDVLGSLDEDLVRGVQYFIKKHVRKTDLVRDTKEKKKLKTSADEALAILQSMQTIDGA